MRLIDADALIQLLQTCADNKWNKNTSAGTWSNAYDEMILHVEDMPSAEPERRGHWIEVNDSYNRISGRCSVCGWESHMCEDDVVGMDYCPNCGAHMMEVVHE